MKCPVLQIIHWKYQIFLNLTISYIKTNNKMITYTLNNNYYNNKTKFLLQLKYKDNYKYNKFNNKNSMKIFVLKKKIWGNWYKIIEKFFKIKNSIKKLTRNKKINFWKIILWTHQLKLAFLKLTSKK